MIPRKSSVAEALMVTRMVMAIRSSTNVTPPLARSGGFAPDIGEERERARPAVLHKLHPDLDGFQPAGIREPLGARLGDARRHVEPILLRRRLPVRERLPGFQLQPLDAA